MKAKFIDRDKDQERGEPKESQAQEDREYAASKKGTKTAYSDKQMKRLRAVAGR